VLDVARWIRDELASLGAVDPGVGAGGAHLLPLRPRRRTTPVCSSANRGDRRLTNPEAGHCQRSVKLRGRRVCRFTRTYQAKPWRPHATPASTPVSAPLTWKVDEGVRRESFTIKTMARRTFLPAISGRPSARRGHRSGARGASDDDPSTSVDRLLDDLTTSSVSTTRPSKTTAVFEYQPHTLNAARWFRRAQHPSRARRRRIRAWWGSPVTAFRAWPPTSTQSNSGHVDQVRTGIDASSEAVWRRRASGTCISSAGIVSNAVQPPPA
jgi:hypothetical protein